jgi:hypothetical protein
LFRQRGRRQIQGWTITGSDFFSAFKRWSMSLGPSQQMTSPAMSLDLELLLKIPRLLHQLSHSRLANVICCRLLRLHCILVKEGANALNETYNFFLL